MAKKRRKVAEPKGYEHKLAKIMGEEQREIERIFNEACKQAATLGAITTELADDVPFSFANQPTAKRAEQLFSKMAAELEAAIINGIRSGWMLANNKHNEMARVLFGDNIGKLTKEQYSHYFSNNDTARDAFVERKENGMNLSDRVWSNVNNFRQLTERGLEYGIRTGQDAPSMARDLKDYLNEPDKLFRRVRDDNGELHLSKAAAEYHPGQGVYRSSHKNALRLAVTETNMAYRYADYERIQNDTNIVGITINLSNNHTCLGSDGKPHEFTDICDELAGDYPKDFCFTGWHPHCRCFLTYILKTEDELMEDMRREWNDEEPIPESQSKNAVNEVPEAFNKWLENNQERIDNAKSKPYFLTDNTKYTGVQPSAEASQKTMTSELAHKSKKQEYENIEMPKIKYTDEQRSNLAEIGEGLGIDKNQITPMSFEKADKGNVNKHNNGSIQYDENCQTCVVTFNARLRGLDVAAAPYYGDGFAKMLANDQTLAYIDPKTGKKPELNLFTQDANRLVKFLEEEVAKNGIYQLGINKWKGLDDGHIMNIIVKDGKYSLFDPQYGIRHELGDVLSNVDLSKGLELLRVDKLLFSKEVASLFGA